LLTGGATVGGSSGTTGGATTGGFGATATGFSWTAGGAAATTGGRGGAVIAGRDETGGWCCCISFSFSSLSTSPGLEILERSILGLISPGAVFSLETAELDLVVKYLLFCYANFQQDIQDGFALYFKLPGQIIDSNLRHPLCFSSKYVRYAIIMTSRFPSFYLAKSQSFASFMARL
jgi:hypothetical protein